MFENVPLPEAWPVYVSAECEAMAFARWRGLGGCPDGGRVSSRGVWRAVDAGRRGSDPGAPVSVGECRQPDSTRGNFDFASWVFRSPSARGLSGLQVPGVSTTWWATDGSGR